MARKSHDCDRQRHVYFTTFAGDDVCQFCGHTLKAVARHSDPDTSHEAAASVKHIRRSQEVVLALLKDLGPVTDEELYVFAQDNMTRSGARTRRKELVDKRLVKDSGMKRLTISGRKSIVWEAV